MQIFPSWTGSMIPAIYLSYKRGVGYDSGINGPSSFINAGKVLVQTWTGTPEGLQSLAPMPDLVATLAPGETHTLRG